jgi:PncC family amidohydrolase
MNEQEAERKETLILLDKWSREAGLNQKQIWFSNNNPRLEEFKNEIGTEINVHSTVRLANFTANSVIHSVGRVGFKPDKEGEFFMCHNRRPRPHRYGLLCLLKKSGVLEDVDWSLVQGFQFKDNKHPEAFFGEIFNNDDITNMRGEIDYFSSIEQKKSRYEEERTWFDDRDNENNVPWNETYDKNQLEIEFQKLLNLLRLLVSKYCFGENLETLETVVGQLLKSSNKTLATAESCTGGQIASAITKVPGCSAYFKGSIVSYANEIKEHFLNVSKDDLINYGAVSKQVVESMAIGVVNAMNVDYAIATSGIAGPDGGSDEKPVGTVWIAVADKHKVFAKQFLFGKNRERTIQAATLTSLNLLRRFILNELE